MVQTREANKGKTKTKKAAVPADPITESGETHDKVADAQVATTSKLQVPVDEGCPLATYRVYIDPASNIIYDASLNQTNASNNNNKFYRIQLLQSPNGDFKTWTRWGRVGERGQSAVLGRGSLDDAILQYEKKFKDKAGLKWDDRGEDPKAGKYVFVERSYLPDDEEAPAAAGAPRERRSHSPPKCTLAPPVRSLMELIFNQQYFEATMVSMNYDSNKLPLGKLSKATITRGFQALKNLAAVMNDPTQAAQYDMPAPVATEHLSNLYYSLIPHAFGRNRPPVIHTNELLKRELELLENLGELKAADEILKAGGDDVEEIHSLDARFQGLGMQEMTPVPAKSAEFTEISQYLLKTCGQTHSVSYEVKDVFRIERQGELARFEKSPYATIESDRRLLWHGSRATNFGGILSQGLRIAPPEAPVNGYMFGKGVYLADMSSKSANYCCSYDSGGEALLLLCEAELGNPMQVLKDASYEAGEDAKEQGLYSTFGKGITGPKGWKDAACVHPSLKGASMPDTTKPPGPTGADASLKYNEFICYDVAQVRLRYLLRVRM
ncbi:hypothetical protein LTR36_010587 [Oleoguttula mirabilis]|uniref:Poly [ADP-ribose] polymerase n=1 Tax=Oleoguttula mirabilis TaxID=1507867 RepID=A0AAV9JS97_9PEZI|nr:hypothetical protein LTR36_010587 [Oleoguttula mirabilis]